MVIEPSISLSNMLNTFCIALRNYFLNKKQKKKEMKKAVHLNVKSTNIKSF
jgi:hypothetical protein